MALNPWSMFDDRFRWFDELTRSMTPFWALGREMGRSASVFPPVNIHDDGEAFLVRAEIPGLNREALEVSVKGEELTIKGERKPFEAKDASYHRRECGSGQFSRVVAMPQPVDADRISATYQNGVLEIVLPRSPQSQPKRISIH
jgi:HSP20 family protein